MHKNPGRSLFIVSVVTFLLLLVALPQKLPILNVEKKPLDIKFGNIQIYRDFNLKLGLDLVGGSHFVYEVNTEGLEQSEKERALAGLKEVISGRINLFGISEANVQLAGFEGKDRIIVELPGVSDPQEAKKLIGQTASLMFARVESTTDELGEATQTLSPSDLTGADIASSQIIFSQVDGSPGVGIEFTGEGSKKFETLTGENVGKTLPIILDGQIISNPVVQEKIVGTSAQITGDFSLDEAKNLSIQINAGALPLEISLLEERTIGPSLGAKSIEKSIQAGLVGVVMVGLLMVLMYRRLGLIAIIGLVLFGIYTLAIYKLVPVVLTLPGIAGFLLSVGMAVDSNILIYERYREERAKDTSVQFALETAFGRAWDSIRDANIATLVAAFVLANPFNWPFLHTSGPVRGFAVTLALGIFISLFTGVFVSRNLLRFFVKEK
jgi:preprotein translocase subunit SecD